MKSLFTSLMSHGRRLVDLTNVGADKHSKIVIKDVLCTIRYFKSHLGRGYG